VSTSFALGLLTESLFAASLRFSASPSQLTSDLGYSDHQLVRMAGCTQRTDVQAVSSERLRHCQPLLPLTEPICSTRLTCSRFDPHAGRLHSCSNLLSFQIRYGPQVVSSGCAAHSLGCLLDWAVQANPLQYTCTVVAAQTTYSTITCLTQANSQGLSLRFTVLLGGARFVCSRSFLSATCLFSVSPAHSPSTSKRLLLKSTVCTAVAQKPAMPLQSETG
jgi:hypothetical protein